MFKQKWAVDLLDIWIRPSCTVSTELAISSGLRAAASGSAKKAAVR
jgi:hypothetical protein